MKTRKLTLALASLMLVSAVFVSSCKKKTETTDSDTSAASDNNMAETTSNDVISMTGQASESGSLSSYRLGGGEDVSGFSCATYAGGTQTFTLTFSGSMCLDGHIRSGSLMFDWSGSTGGATHYRNPGYKCVVTSSGYIVDGNAITVNKTITNTTAPGFNPATTNLTWLISSSLTIVKANNGGTINWNCPARTKTLLNTSDTTCYHGQATAISWGKAKIGITGNANCTSSTGLSFEVNITSQLVRDMTCSPDANHPGRHPFVQGSLNFTPNGKYTRYIDYGSGGCDLTYTVEINGNTYTLTMP